MNKYLTKILLKINNSKLINKTHRLIKRPVLAIVFGLSCIVGLFLISVVVTNCLVYANKTNPNLRIANISAGGLSRDELTNLISSKLLQTPINLKFRDQIETESAKNLGINVDQELQASVFEKRHLKRLLKPWFIKENAQPALKNNYHNAEKTIHQFSSKNFVASKNAEFYYRNGKLTIVPEVSGFGIDTVNTMDDIAQKLTGNLSGLDYSLKPSQLKVEIKSSDIEALRDQILLKLSGKYSIKSADSVITAPKAEVSKWLVAKKSASNQIETGINEKAIKNFVLKQANKANLSPVSQVTSSYKSGKPVKITTQGKVGRKVNNIDAIVTELVTNLNQGQATQLTFRFDKIAFGKSTKFINDAIIKKVYTYSVAVWGSVKSDLASFKSLAAATLADSRGWPAAGIGFKQVSSNGNFTLVLAEPARVASASTICSAEYSCRVGRNVIINDARWRGATPSWNKAGGSLRDYRHMVVNHETGHWLGFGHRNCSSPGALAPVMQQQSISLQGCRFNPWPTTSELSALH